MLQQPVETTLYSLSSLAPMPDDRRQAQRHLTLYRVGLLDLEGRRELCLIKNISSGGMMIRAYCRLAIGEGLTIELKCGQPVRGRISWVEGESAGICFDSPVDVIDILTAASTDRRPRMPRIATSSPVTLRQDGQVFAFELLDISQGGIRIAGQVSVAPGRDLTVVIPGLPTLQGRLCWREGEMAGITFHGLLPLAPLINWLQAQREGVRKAG